MINGAGVDGLSYVNIDGGNVISGGCTGDFASYAGSVIQVSQMHNWKVLKDCHGTYDGVSVEWKAGYTFYEPNFPTVVVIAD